MTTIQRFDPCYRGDTYGPYDIGVDLDAGTLAACTEITLTVRNRAVKTDPALVQLTMTGGRITIPAPSTLRFHFTDDEAAALPARPLRADIECLLPDGTRKTLRDLDQELIVYPDVT
jgi:hypothetical protein